MFYIKISNEFQLYSHTYMYVRICSKCFKYIHRSSYYFCKIKCTATWLCMWNTERVPFKIPQSSKLCPIRPSQMCIRHNMYFQNYEDRNLQSKEMKCISLACARTLCLGHCVVMMNGGCLIFTRLWSNLLRIVWDHRI